MPDPVSTNITIECGNETVPVMVQFKNRSKLSISVHPDGSVTALAPLGRTLNEVATHLGTRRSWILKQRQRFDKYRPLQIQHKYVSGETHLYLGRQYRLRVKESDEDRVKLIGRYFNIQATDPNDIFLIADSMGEWYRRHAESIFASRLEACLNSVPVSMLRPSDLRVRMMQRRWGSCSKQGTITLNIDLVKAPLHCIEYVVMHELCHLREYNHSPSFYRLLGRCMPDWKKRKERLDSFALR